MVPSGVIHSKDFLSIRIFLGNAKKFPFSIGDFSSLFDELEANAAPTVLSCTLSSVPPSLLSDLVSENQVN